MNIIDLLTGDKITFKKVAGTNGGEFVSVCPGCGGTDRFRAWPAEGDGGKWWCRGCNKGGDCLQYLREFRAMGYRDACLYLGIEPVQSRLLSWERKRPEGWEPKVASEPSSEWKEKAAVLIDWAEKQLWSDAGRDCLDWLTGERGLTEATIEEFHLGWIPKNMVRPREDWGLPESLKEDGSKKPLWLPRGLVIPFLVEGGLWKVKIRRPDPNTDLRYYMLPGSSGTRAMTAGRERRFVGVIESELDLILLHQEAGDLASYVALGSATNKPDRRAFDLLSNAERVFVMLDYDPAGEKSAWKFWTDQFDRATRWPPIRGKDPGEMRKKGVSVRKWVEAGIGGQASEGPKPVEPPKQAGGRDEIGRIVRELYWQIADTCAAGHWDKLKGVPCWVESLNALEDAFAVEWTRGSDCVAEFEALREHWMAGLEEIGGKA